MTRGQGYQGKMLVYFKDTEGVFLFFYEKNFGGAIKQFGRKKRDNESNRGQDPLHPKKGGWYQIMRGRWKSYKKWWEPCMCSTKQWMKGEYSGVENLFETEN